MGDVAKPASPASMEELWAHRAWVHRVARALVADPSRADDLEQETWIRAQASPPRHGSALKAWLGTVMRRLASDLRRSDRRRLHRERAAARPEGLPSAADLLAEAEALERVVRAVVDLEEPYRATMLLRYVDDLGPTEVAERLGLPLETVRTRLKRGLALLRDRFDAASGGDRRAWSVSLLPLTRRGVVEPPFSVGGVPFLGVVLGGVAVTLKSKTAVAIVVVLLAAVGAGTAILAPSRQPAGDREATPTTAPPLAEAPGLRPRPTSVVASSAAPVEATSPSGAAGSGAPMTATTDADAASLVVEVVDEGGRRVSAGSLALSAHGLGAVDLLGLVSKDMDRYGWFLETYDLSRSNPIEVKGISREFVGHELRATADVPRYPPRASDPFVVEAGKLARVRIEMVVGRPVAFEVVEAESGRPVPGARVVSGTETSRRRIFASEVTGPGGPGWATAGPDGRCTVTELGAGPHEIEVTAPGFRAARRDFAKLEPGPVVVRLERARDDAVLEVVVTDPDGAPVADFRVEVHGPSQRAPLLQSTDAQGIARFAGLAPGLQTARFDGADWVRRSTQGHWPGAPREVLMGWVELPRGEARRIAIGYPKGTGVIALEVVDAEGTPVVGALVRLYGPSLLRDGRTDAAGRATFSDLGAGEYQTIVQRSDGDRWTDAEPRPLAEGGRLDVRRVVGDRSLSGVVRAATEGRPGVVGAHVFVTGGQFAGTSTVEDGKFSFRDVPPGRYRVSGSVDGFAANGLEVDVVGEGDTRVPEIVLQRGGLVRLQVPVSDRARLDTVVMRLVDVRGEEVMLRPDPTGEDFRISDRVSSGRYLLELMEGGTVRSRRDVDVVDGTDAVVALTAR